MKNIMKAQLYQLKKERLVFVVFLVVLIMQCTTMFGEMADQAAFTASGYMAENGYYIPLISMIFATVFTAQICGSDFMDKTGNYELMSGHGRKDAYFGRAVLALVGGTLGALLLTVFPMIVSGAMGGFGDTLKLSDVVLRYVLSVFPIMRVICTFICLTYIVKNSYIVMVCGVYCFIAGEMLWEMADKGAYGFLGITSLSRLFHFDAWSTYTLVGEQRMSFYNSALPVGDIFTLILSSVVFGGLFLLLGYLYYQKDDLN